MKVGDLVKITTLNNEIGLIVGVVRAHRPKLFQVLVRGSINKWRSRCLEVVSESR